MDLALRRSASGAASQQRPAALAWSVIVPVHNEIGVLRASVERLLEEFRQRGASFELILCENGSTDGTAALADALAREHPEIRTEHLPTPNYGVALRHAMTICRAETVMLFNVDFWNMAFVQEALRRLTEADLVIGSKALPASRDERPRIRRLITRRFNQLLRWVFRFRGTDTHGMKVFRRAPVEPLIARCVTDHFIFDTELVLRAQRQGLRIVEIPVFIRELRQPSYRSLARRSPQVVWNLAKLWVALRRQE